ncbi:hypothetical protein DUPY_39270 [Duganella phyllosphaerae]|uniref:Uncharacterized protein n=1 Tax=Duganella phyllosphaerae TaxID=762836 RepID=A0A1E7WE46_9BURK|nr:hypothetical protein DUPY_39270 [Duganella phyllosphaerae]
MRGRLALEEVHGDRGVRHRLALQVEHHHLEFQGVTAEHPVVGRNAHHHGRRPQVHAGGGRQGFAVGVLVRQLGRQFARHRHCRQLVDGHARTAGLVQREIAGAHRTADSTGARFGFTVVEYALVIVKRAAFAFHAHLYVTITEGEVAIIVEAHRLVLHHGAQLHRRVAGAAAGQVAQLHVEVERGYLHRRRLRPLQQRLHGRHTELLDAEAAGHAAAHQHLVPALARVERDGPVVGGAAVGAPHQRQLVALVAALVDHEHAGWQRLVRLERKTVHDLATLEVLHVHRLAGAQQGAVEHRVGDDVIGAGVFGGQVEAPALDAAIPFRQGERHVGAVACADEQAFATLAHRFRQLPGDIGHAVVVGAALPQQLAGAIAHGHLGARYWQSFVERRHPHQRRLRAAFEVGHQVGHQRSRTDVRGLALARQSLAEARAGQFHYVEARLFQGDAHHLELLAAARLGHGKALHAVGAAVLDFEAGQQLLVHLIAVQFAWLPAAVATHAPEPAHDLPVLLLVGGAFVHAQRRTFDIDRSQPGGQRRLDVAHGDRQQLVALRLDNAEARREFHQRRLGVRVDRHRKARGVEQRTAGVVLQAGGQRQAQAAARRQRADKADVVHVVGLGLVFFRHRLEDLAAGAGERGGQRIGAPYRRRKGDPGGQKRQAPSLGRKPLAGESGGEVGPDAKCQHLVLARGDAVGGSHASAPHQRHFRLGRQGPLA